MDRIKELENLIPMYAKAYYEGQAIIPDAEFDKLTEELERLDPANEILHTPGWGGAESNGIKKEHKYGMVGSLVKTREFIRIPEIFRNQTVIVSPKLDGLSLVAYYENGKLVSALTRGNGILGIEQYDKALRIIRYKQNIPSDFTGAVRGELLMPQIKWQDLKDNSSYSNSRNAVAGIMNMKWDRNFNVDLLDYIDFVPYKIIGADEEFIKENLLNEDGLVSSLIVKQWIEKYFLTPAKFVCELITEEKLNELYNCEEWNYYQLDGLVLSDCIIKYGNKFGEMSWNEFAFKFESEKAETKVESITWNLSKNGRMVPQLNLTPVEILETTVRNCTGNNAQWIADRNIKVGTRVMIEKKNEIIPGVVAVYNEENQEWINVN